MTKRRTYFFFLAFLCLVGWLPAQTYLIEVSGTITDLNNQPVPNHGVTIFSDSSVSTFQYSNVVYTNATGFYLDSIQVPFATGAGTLIVGTSNCGTYNVLGTLNYSPNITQFSNVDGQICANPSGGLSCYAQFSSSAGSGNGASFSDASNVNQGYVASYSWDFGDGNVSSQSNPSHTYAAPGLYLVCLDIVALSNNNQDTCFSSYCDSVVVGNGGGGGGSSCQAFFMSWVNGNTVNFYDSSMANPGNVTSWYWTFGDGSTSTAANPSHTYANGIYMACLSITTSDSCTSTYCDSVFVGNGGGGGGGGGTQCNASWYAAPDSSGQYSLLIFNTSTGGSNLNYFWDFGDGTTSSQAYPSHQYNGPGVYVICLTVTDSTTPAGCTSTYCDSVAVFQKVNAPFSINVVSPLAAVPDPYQVNGLSVQLYPQPVAETAFLKVELLEASPVMARWYDVQGRMVNQQDLGFHNGGQQRYELNTDGMPKGMYLLRVETKLGGVTQKVLLQD